MLEIYLNNLILYVFVCIMNYNDYTMYTSIYMYNDYTM